MRTAGYPDQEEIDGLSEDLVWIDEQFLRSDPAAFATASIPFTVLSTFIARELEIDRNGVFCVGSGAMGLSFNPGKISGSRLKCFDEKSDIDIAVISAHHFEIAWRDLRSASQPHLVEVPEGLRKALNWQKKRFFDGVILVKEVLPHLSFAPLWQGAMERISQEIVRAVDSNIDVNFWLFRDYWSLRNYISEGLQKCRQKIKSG